MTTALDRLQARALRHADGKRRCAWCGFDPLYVAYHDAEWGVPVHDDRRLFEMLCLEGAQAGLSWLTILRKRENYRRAFAGFDAARMARYGARERARLMNDPGIVRNRLKIAAFIDNATAYLQIRTRPGAFDRYIWQFSDGRVLRRRPLRQGDVAATSVHSDALSKDLKSRGFHFVGSTICYAFMQAVGMIDEHQRHCWAAASIRAAAGAAVRAAPAAGSEGAAAAAGRAACRDRAAPRG
ncbi:MAG TPA: DNA-3-methyladenine glycosylase I [Steroidobacteraceae bacterium]|nr:DNA-3-methyladenine glycosylase I [Steroidobacteraceae bacterium]